MTNASCTPRECLQIEDSAENRSRTNDRASLEYKTSSSRRETLISFTSPSLDSHQSLNTPEVAAQAAMWDSEKSSLVCPAQTSELLPNKASRLSWEVEGFMNNKYVRMGTSISLGLCFGAALGTALHNLGVGMALGVNVGVGIALGVSLGTVFGAALGMAPDAASAPKRPAAEKPLPHPLGL